MTWSDPIVDEVRRVREAYAARFNHDLRAIYRDLKEQEKRSGRTFVSYAEKDRAGDLRGDDSTENIANKTIPPTTPLQAVPDNIPSQQTDPATER